MQWIAKWEEITKRKETKLHKFVLYHPHNMLFKCNYEMNELSVRKKEKKVE